MTTMLYLCVSLTSFSLNMICQSLMIEWKGTLISMRLIEHIWLMMCKSESHGYLLYTRKHEWKLSNYTLLKAECFYSWVGLCTRCNARWFLYTENHIIYHRNCRQNIKWYFRDWGRKAVKVQDTLGLYWIA